MPRKNPPKDATQKENRIILREFRLTSPQKRPFPVQHHDAPPRYARRERIHPRRVLPRVREGRERAFHSVTRELAVHLQSIMPVGIRGASDDLAIITNTALTQPGQQQLASSVGEPSTAADDKSKVVMYTGNWYAARSIDGGLSFQFINPFNSFPDPDNLGFCCDQVVNYIPSIDTFVWLLQYGPKSGPDADNIQRLAFATSDNVKAGSWRLFDITTQSLGVPGQFLDFPDLAVGANSLYVTTNIFTPQGRGAGAAVVRIPIQSIKDNAVTAQSFVSPDVDSFRVAQNCGTKAFFAAHADTSTLRVFSWDEGDDSPASTDVGVARWIGAQGYQSRTPDGQRWLDRVDPRITGATLAGNELWFAWSVDSGSNQRPNAFVQIAHIDATNLTLIEDVNVFDTMSATAYGALSSNSDNEVAISYMIGGPNQFPSLMVGILTGTRKDLLAFAGERGPLDAQWGDFLTVRPLFPDRELFVATGYTMNGTGDGSNRDATPRYVVFGRSGVSAPAQPGPGPSTPPPKPPIPSEPLPPTPAADGGPITDVNTLPIVSSGVADQIKGACGLAVAGPEAAPMVSREALPVAAAQQADKPGSERWPVKTGQDPDRAKVGKNVVNGNDLGAGIVETTIEELISLPRPTGLADATKDPPAFKSVRANQTEVTIWRLEATITGLKHEADGDYHLVLKSNNTTAEMVGEIPTPSTVFVGDSPWLANIADARQQIDDKLIKHLQASAFSLMNGKYVPHGAAMYQNQRQSAPPGLRFDTPPPGSMAVQPLFDVAITPTRIRLTGVGFFDRAHGATGAAPNVIELHPVLKVEFV